MALPPGTERLCLKPRPDVLRGLEGVLERTARRLDAVDPRPPARSDDDLRPVLRLVPRAGARGSEE